MFGIWTWVGHHLEIQVQDPLFSEDVLLSTPRPSWGMTSVTSFRPCEVWKWLHLFYIHLPGASPRAMDSDDDPDLVRGLRNDPKS